MLLITCPKIKHLKNITQIHLLLLNYIASDTRHEQGCVTLDVLKIDICIMLRSKKNKIGVSTMRTTLFNTIGNHDMQVYQGFNMMSLETRTGMAVDPAL